MRTLLIIALLVCLAPMAFSQSGKAKCLVVAPGCSGGIPVRCGPSGVCQITACVFHQCKIPLCECCERVDQNGTVWAKVEIKGWIKVQNGDSRMMCTGLSRSDKPVCKLQPCTVVQKTNTSVPNYGCIYGAFTGWVVKESGGVKFLCEV